MDFTNRPIKMIDINNEQRRIDINKEQRRIGSLTLENQILKNENYQLRRSIQQQSPELSPPLKNPEISKAKEWIEQGGSIHC